MPEEKRFDVAIIGAGPGGYVAAIRAAQLGLSVVLFEERETLGGTCLNIGCIPSKALLESSERFVSTRDGSASHGIIVGSVGLDLEAMMARKDGVVKQLTGGVGALMKGNGVTVVEGRAELSAGGTVRTAGGVYKAGAVVLATGSVEQELPFLPFDHRRIVSSTDALSFESVPERLVVIGAGVIGLELGSVWSRLGSAVTVIEIMDSILPGMDRKSAKVLEKELKRQGIEFMLSSKVTGAESGENETVLTVEGGDGKAVNVSGDKVLVAVGRRPNIGPDIEAAGIAVENGRIRIDERFRTSVDGVYAIGDVVRGPMLAHKAEEEGAAVAEIIAGKGGHVNYGTIPSVVYTWPEMASVGYTEEGLVSAGIPYRHGEFPFRVNARALALGSSAGSVKILAHERSDEILGAHIVGPWASDLIAEIVSVMEFKGSAEDVARTVHAHPTLSEAVKEAALAVDGRPIHSLSKKVKA